jgi:hypothetical protein
MKKIIIELTEEQHEKMKGHLARGGHLNLEHETFSGYGIKLCCTGIEDWLEIDMYGIITIRKYKIKSA